MKQCVAVRVTGRMLGVQAVCCSVLAAVAMINSAERGRGRERGGERERVRVCVCGSSFAFLTYYPSSSSLTPLSSSPPSSPPLSPQPSHRVKKTVVKIIGGRWFQKKKFKDLRGQEYPYSVRNAKQNA